MVLGHVPASEDDTLATPSTNMTTSETRSTSTALTAIGEEEIAQQVEYLEASIEVLRQDLSGDEARLGKWRDPMSGERGDYVESAGSRLDGDKDSIETQRWTGASMMRASARGRYRARRKVVTTLRPGEEGGKKE